MLQVILKYIHAITILYFVLLHLTTICTNIIPA
jgi:hypothetical protein